MAAEEQPSVNAQQSVPLKLEDPPIDDDHPWRNDLLGRQGIAARLTNLVAKQKPPLTISLHGQWGTGKTFLLKRWQKALGNEGYQAIYLNAWEDDFSDDPLLAILGQLVDYFRESPFKDSVDKLVKGAIPLLRSNLVSLLNRHTGLTTEFEHELPTKDDLVNDYLRQRSTKDQLKKNLEDLSMRVQKDGGHPLVFIIDELDRCRPTYAIELLERVKHMFDVPNIVFVFGINRDELCKSLASVYGEIKTDVYLRRFFDFEFNLPESDSQGFTLSLIDRFQIAEAFDSLTNQAGDPVHKYDYDNYRRISPRLWAALGLSLRDIDYGIRLLALLAKSVPNHTFSHPYLLSFLIGMKFKNPDLYTQLITRSFQASKVMDLIANNLRQDFVDENLTRILDRLEGFLYCADIYNNAGQVGSTEAHAQLAKLLNGDYSSEAELEVLSQRARTADSKQLQRMLRAISDGRSLGVSVGVFAHLATLIDTHQAILRR